MFCVVTGGAGFIGSHLVDALVARGDRVLVIDNLCTGNPDHIQDHISAGRITFLQADLCEAGWQEQIKGAQRVYHIAADPDVRASANDPRSVLRNNIDATNAVLEAMRTQQVPEIVFTSTSTVYGEAAVIPTPEDYAPMIPISTYGGAKLANEAMISAYTATFGLKAWVFRFANIIGERSNHGIIWDFIHKLKDNPAELEILGDGSQMKSYLSVTACVKAVIFATEHAHENFNFFNIGSEDWISVADIADVIVEEMALPGVKYRFTGGDRGWVGDVPKMQLSVEKLKNYGWTPGETSRDALRAATQALIRELEEV